MKKGWKKWMIMISLVGVLGLVACGGNNAESTETESQIQATEDVTSTSMQNTETESETEVQLTEEIPENQNLLTGLATLTEEAIGKRPVAIMINNIETDFDSFLCELNI